MIEYKVWVGCLACYNEGKLVGDWFDAADCPQNEAEFNERVTVPNTHKYVLGPHEELWVFDHEGSPVDGEYAPMDAARYAGWLSDLEEYEREGFDAYVKHHGTFDEDSVEGYREALQGQYTSDEDFAQSLAEDLGLTNDEASWPYTCIDWGRAARELMMDYYEEDGFYFRS